MPCRPIRAPDAHTCWIGAMRKSLGGPGSCPEQFRYQASGVEGPTSHINDSKLEGLPCGLRKGEKV